MADRTRPAHETIGDPAFAVRINAVAPRGMFQALDFESMDPFELLTAYASLRAQRMALEHELAQVDEMLKQFDPYVDMAVDGHGGAIPFAIGAEQFELAKDKSLSMRVRDTDKLIPALDRTPGFADMVRRKAGYHHGQLWKRVRDTFAEFADEYMEEYGEPAPPITSTEHQLEVLGRQLADQLDIRESEEVTWGKPKAVRT